MSLLSPTGIQRYKSTRRSSAERQSLAPRRVEIGPRETRGVRGNEEFRTRRHDGEDV